MRISPFVAAVGLVVLGLLGPVASAAHADDASRAKELFQEGTRYFDLGHFDKAIDSWQSGYRQKPDPVFLYNIAQAYRLAGDLSKAIFFYKGYLRNSPKASNRAEVELKIQGLQKQLAEEQQAKAGQRPATPAPAPTPEPGGEPARPRPASTAAPKAPPPAAKPPPPTASPARSGPGAPSGPTTAATSAAPATPGAGPRVGPGHGPHGSVAAPIVTGPAPAPLDEIARPLDFGVGVGFDGWSSGVQGKADPSFALMLTAGYTPGHDPAAPVRFRIGGSFGYTFLKEAASKDTFVSLLVVPTLLIRAGARVGFFGELGVGVVGISGLVPTSGLLDHTMMLKINGTQSLVEIRPALGLQIQLTPGVGLFASGALDYSPKGTHFYKPISRTELLLGLSLRR